MQIKMIRDKDNLKKEQTYDIDEKKATDLLTAGYCLRVRLKAEDTATEETAKRKNNAK